MLLTPTRAYHETGPMQIVKSSCCLRLDMISHLDFEPAMGHLYVNRLH